MTESPNNILKPIRLDSRSVDLISDNLAKLAKEKVALKDLQEKTVLQDTLKFEYTNNFGKQLTFHIYYFNAAESLGISTKSGYYLTTDKVIGSYGIAPLYLGEESEEVEQLMALYQKLNSLTLANNEVNAQNSLETLQTLFAL